MTASYDSIQAHLDAAGDWQRAAVPLGWLFSWAVMLGLVDENRLEVTQNHLVRLKMRDVSPSELLVSAGGVLRREWFTAAGQRFFDDYFPRFFDDCVRLFDGELYGLDDSWDNYDRLATQLTRAYLGDPATSADGQIGWRETLRRWLKRR